MRSPRSWESFLHFRLGPESRFKILSPRSEAQHCDGSAELNIFGKEGAIFKVQSCCQTCGVNAEDGDGEKVTGQNGKLEFLLLVFWPSFFYTVFFLFFLPFAPSAGLPRIRRRKEGTIRAGLVWAAFGSFRHRVLVRVLWLGCCHSFFLFIEWQASMVESTQQDRVTIYLKNVLLFSDTASNSCANLIELQVCGTFPPLKGWRHCFSSYLADPTDTLAKTVGFSVFTH